MRISYVGYRIAIRNIKINGISLLINIQLKAFGPANWIRWWWSVMEPKEKDRRNRLDPVGHIKGDELVKQPVLTATQALQGKVAGVQVISSGQPGGQPQVIIRGSGSILAGGNPLYIVDGIWTDDITNINTADIATIDVLKDASACSIYGVRGANGVILITTKQGSGKIKVNLSVNVGVHQAAYVVPTMANSTESIYSLTTWKRQLDCPRRLPDFRPIGLTPSSAKPFIKITMSRFPAVIPRIDMY